MVRVEKEEYTLLLFRKNLRVKDNHALNKAISLGLPVLCLYCLDIKDWDRVWYALHAMGENRKRFVVECVEDLDNTIKIKGGRLYVDDNDPVTSIMMLHEKYANMRYMVSTIEPGSFEAKEQKLVSKYCAENNIRTHWMWDHTMIHINDLPDCYADYNIPRFFKEYYEKLKLYQVSNIQVLPIPNRIVCPPFEYQTLSDIRKSYPALCYKRRSVMGGEFHGNKSFETYVQNLEKTTTFEDIHKPSYLSAWITNGALSVRDLSRTLIDLHTKLEVRNDNLGPNQGDESGLLVMKMKRIQHFFAGLMWRDYFHYLYFKHENNWFKLGGIQRKTRVQMQLNDNLMDYDRWEKGYTGFPFIDASIRALRAVGYIPEKSRSNIAYFLVHKLKIDWRWGAEFFEHHLVDHDLASNIVQWQFMGGVGHQKFAPGQDHKEGEVKPNHSYSAVDKDDIDLIRKYVPELENVGDEFIFTPWMDPKCTQYIEPMYTKEIYPLVNIPQLQ